MRTVISIMLTMAILLMPSIALATANANEKAVKTTSTVQTKVNVNSASIKQLSALKGIGIKRAEAIVEYRSTYGKFKSVDDLLNVKGIGEKFIAKNKANLAI